MCGISGFVGPAEAQVDPGVIRSMTEVLRHRGPDGYGECAISDQLDGRRLAGWLGHQRLKIIDLTEAADQPMKSDDGSIALTYNGEVYNFRELRRRLERAGHRFRSTGDTEVVLRAYEEWGDGFVSELDGMFAIAIWDGRRARMLLARDRTGKKPLFYTTMGGRFAFASEIKALLCAPWVEPRPDPTTIPEFLRYGYVHEPKTMYEGIFQLAPAATISYGLDGLADERPYWDALPDDQMARLSADAAETIASLVEKATRRRMIADVPLGALLSGGIDSSIVVGLMAKTATEPIRTFSVGFPEDTTFDERPYARLVAERFGTIHTEFAVKIDAVGLLDQLLWHHDQPFADSSAIPTYLVSRLAREHVTVALNGDGGDEVFAGYYRFLATRVSEFIPRPILSILRRGARVMPVGNGYYDLGRRAERFLEAACRPVHERYRTWISVVGDELLAALLESRELSEQDDPLYGYLEEANRLQVLDRVLYANFKTYLPGDLAVKMDRMSMANSLETRSPFLDTALIEHVARIPGRYKVSPRQVKPLLRRAFRPMLPDVIWKRRKHGFAVPMDRWFSGELGTLFEDEVLVQEARSSAYLSSAAVRNLWADHQQGRRPHGSRLWAILTLERWLRSLEGELRREAPPGEFKEGSSELQLKK